MQTATKTDARQISPLRETDKTQQRTEKAASKVHLLRPADINGPVRRFLHRWSIATLRVALGLVFLWFGALKVLGGSPAEELVKETYSFLPFHPFFLLLGLWEVAIGCGMISSRGLRLTLVLLCLHLAGTFGALLLAPRLFFLGGNPLWLTMEGEFLVKNLVLMAAGLVIAGHELRPIPARRPEFASR
jgi:putative oxidoreductase